MAGPSPQAKELLEKLVEALTVELHHLGEADAAAREQARIWRALREHLAGTRIVRALAPLLGYRRSGPELQLLARAFGKRMQSAWSSGVRRALRGRRRAGRLDEAR